MTEYVILSKRGTDDTWQQTEKNVSAASAKAAVREALNGADTGGEFVAIPVRSWQPVKVSIERQVKLS